MYKSRAKYSIIVALCSSSMYCYKISGFTNSPLAVLVLELHQTDSNTVAEPWFRWLPFKPPFLCIFSFVYLNLF